MQIKNFADNVSSTNDLQNVNYCEEVMPAKIVRKTPKFPSRERHLAIRRRKPVSPESQKSECLDMSIDDDSDESIKSGV